ncbi:MAG: branched-subunit amino acid transport protein [Paracoccaceae bacterium]|jgi:branched-subunit amino acid transport protein
MNFSETQIWTIILSLGIGSFLLRFSFLGMIGNRRLPEWTLRLLRYTPMAVIPGLVAPMVLWPTATQGHIDPARLLAGLAAIVIGLWTRNVIASVLVGLLTLYAMNYLLT